MTKFILVYAGEPHDKLRPVRRRVGTTALALTLVEAYTQAGEKVAYSGIHRDKLQVQRGIKYSTIIIDSMSREGAVQEFMRLRGELHIDKVDSVQFIQVDATFGLDDFAPPYGPEYVKKA